MKEPTKEESMNGQARTYYAIPGYYDIGEAFDTLGEALAACTERIAAKKEQNETQGTLNPLRSYVDVRVKDDEGDRPITRYIIEEFVATNA